MSRIIERILVFVFIFLLIFNNFNFCEENMSTKIQLRIRDGYKSAQKMDDLKLYINKQEVRITGKERRDRYIGQEGILGRNFILTFMNFPRFNKKLEDAISYFVTEILRKSDSLIVHTNINTHQIKVTGNKERMILNIVNHLKKDMNYISGRSARVYKSINAEIERMERFFGTFDSTTTILTIGDVYFNFFATIIPDLQFYKNEFVIPDKKRFEEIGDLLGFREGDRYWIFIQNGNIYPFMTRIRKIIKSVGTRLSLVTTGDQSWKKMVSTKIREMEDSMLIDTPYPRKTMRTLFINTNTTFYTLLFSTESVTSTNKKIDLQLLDILGKISVDSGGKLIETSDIEADLRKIREFKDRFWNINFVLPETKKNIKFRMEIGGRGKDLVYRKQLKKDEYRKLKKYLSKPKVFIEKPEFSKNKLSFSIGSFSLNKRGGFGLIKVVIQTYDNSGKEVYRRSNILRTGRKKIDISIGIPEELFFHHKTRISVLDLISNVMVANELRMN